MSETPELPPPVSYRIPEAKFEPFFGAEQMLKFWDAGRRAGLEEAAKLADPNGWSFGCPCAEAIRACGGTGRAKP